MDINHYQDFKELEERGLRKKASKSLRAFISSFNNEKEIEEWVWEYLPKLETNRHSRIRHEIFHELIYPILRAGYERQEFSSTLWLGKLVTNICNSRKLHEELGWVTGFDLYNKSHNIDPENDEARLLLLQSIISGLKYSEHEWPSGILHSDAGATIEECDEINADVQKALQLDKECKYTKFIEQYLEKLSEYRARLNSSSDEI